MKIENTGKVTATPPSDIRSRAPANTATQVASNADKVQLSSLSSSMQKAETALAETPVVDKQRVQEISQAIADGRFKVDADRIADGLIASVREMLDAR
jgi:negative regulator of flagellin synthesis FlgM